MATSRGSQQQRTRLPHPGNLPAIAPIVRAFQRLRGLVGRHLSVRAKLTIWYGAMCGLTLTLAGAGMYTYVQHSLDRQIDDALVSTSSRVSAQLARGLAAGPAPRSPAASLSNNPYLVPDCKLAKPKVQLFCSQVRSFFDRESASLSSPGQFEEVLVSIGTAQNSLQPLGPVFVTANGVPHFDLGGPEPMGLLIEAAAGEIHYRTVNIGGQTLRAYVTPLVVPPQLSGLGIAGVLIVFQNEKNYLGVEHTVLLTLIVGVPLGLIIALAAGWLIARAALRPINRISRTVRAIGDSKDMSRRLDFVGPYDEVGRLAETFDGMMTRLERVFETQKRFIADASHELRTPLTAIRGNADLMKRAPPEDRDICLASIRREAERMSRLVSDLLLLAEADVAEQQLQVSRVDLENVLLDVYHSTQVIAGDKVDVVLEHADSVCVDGDPDRLKQLLLNLADNAVKFTPAGGTVSLGLRQQDGQARLSVSDSGVGIPPDEQEAIFQRFYRLEEARTKRGSGLGLAICAWIVRAHGGTIEVNSQPGKGSTFSVLLPRAAEAVSPARAPE